MNTDYDVIIIGAGPAGSTCGKVLSKNNIKTLIIEKRKIPRYKACGGLVSDRALEVITKYFGNIPQNIICSNSKVFAAISKDAVKFIPVRDSLHIKTERSKLDEWLARSSNTDLMEESYYLSHNNINNDLIEVNIIKNNKIMKLRCKYLVGADGGNSKLRRNIDNEYKLKKMFISRQDVYEGEINIDKDKYYFIKNENFSDFFSWYNIENNNIFIGSIFYIENKSKNYVNIIKTHLEKIFNLKTTKKIRSEVCLGDSRLSEDRYNFGNKNIIFIGEASGLIYSFGEGLPSAFISGEYGAYSIIESIETKTPCAKIYKNKIQPEKEYSRTGNNVW